MKNTKKTPPLLKSLCRLWILISAVAGLTAHADDFKASYLGCFANDGYSMPGKKYGPLDNMSLEKCNEDCSKKHTYFFGVEFGNTCYCSNIHGDERTPDKCTLTCSGNPNEICGGSYAVGVYRTSAKGARVAPALTRIDGGITVADVEKDQVAPNPNAGIVQSQETEKRLDPNHENFNIFREVFLNQVAVHVDDESLKRDYGSIMATIQQIDAIYRGEGPSPQTHAVPGSTQLTESYFLLSFYYFNAFDPLEEDAQTELRIPLQNADGALKKIVRFYGWTLDQDNHVLLYRGASLTRPMARSIQRQISFIVNPKYEVQLSDEERSFLAKAVQIVDQMHGDENLAAEGKLNEATQWRGDTDKRIDLPGRQLVQLLDAPDGRAKLEAIEHETAMNRSEQVKNAVSFIRSSLSAIKQVKDMY